MNTTDNRDLWIESPERLARANRIAAETERANPYWSPAEREARAAHYEALAREYEGRAAA